MGKRGPIGQTVTELKLRGQFRSDRHGKRASVEEALTGEPVKPSYLRGEAAKCWERIVPQLTTAGRVKAIHADMLVCVCLLWADFRAAKNAGERRLAYYAYRDAESKIGLSPASQSRIPIADKPEEKAYSLSGSARKRG